MDLQIGHKVAMVSGASKGLGFAVAEALAKEGARLSIASEDAEGIAAAAAQLKKTYGTPVIGVQADVRDAVALSNWHTATTSSFGAVDMLFTNSGGPPPGQAMAFDVTAWQSASELLLLSVIHLVRLVVPGMEAQGGGSILMSTSTSVKEPIPNLALSNVVRSSVAALAKTLSIELGPKHIRVNSILPGRIATDRMQQYNSFAAAKEGIAVADVEARIAGSIPLGRFGTPEEFGKAAAFLMSDAASYLSGVSLQVDGGLTRNML